MQKVYNLPNGKSLPSALVQRISNGDFPLALHVKVMEDPTPSELLLGLTVTVTNSPIKPVVFCLLLRIVIIYSGYQL